MHFNRADDRLTASLNFTSRATTCLGRRRRSRASMSSMSAFVISRRYVIDIERFSAAESGSVLALNRRIGNHDDVTVQNQFDGIAVRGNIEREVLPLFFP